MSIPFLPLLPVLICLPTAGKAAGRFCPGYPFSHLAKVLLLGLLQIVCQIASH